MTRTIIKGLCNERHVPYFFIYTLLIVLCIYELFYEDIGHIHVGLWQCGVELNFPQKIVSPMDGQNDSGEE